MARIDAATELTPQALGEIQAAIVHGYDRNSLGRLVRFNWGLKLSDEFDVDHGFKTLVAQLLDYSESDGRVAELLALAYSGKPGNPKLQDAAGKYLADPAAALAKYDPASTPDVPATLEALVNERSRLFDFGQFMARVRSVGVRICRMEVPGGGGTGWLAGRTHVLTNYHVMKPVIEGGIAIGDVTCRFDFWSTDKSAPAPSGTPVQAESIVASRPYSQSDLTGTGSPAEDELDYALVRLKEPAGSSKTGDGAERGWFEFGPAPSIVARGDVAMIPQHPNARTLEIAYGTVVEFPAAGLRYRYDVTTEPGSSGSPVFTPDVSLYGLHHAAQPQHNPTFNQAVPLWRIARDLGSKQVDWAA